MEQAIVTFAAQHGPWAAFCVVMFIGCALLVKWVLSTSQDRESRLNENASKREDALQKIISDQTAVINKQSEALESQSNALNRITDKLENLDRSVTRIEKRLDT